ncbi:MAG TPA: DUF1573 domain-containing protein [Ignavibacteriaceae bacterium]|nr:DUF1573 domain-containing protein [Ignavibacteriaceae bacterium]
MTKKIVLLLFLICPIIFGQTIRPRIAVQSVEHDFSSSGSFKFIIFNSGGGVLKINKIHTTCRCVTADLDKKEVNIGDSAFLSVTYSGSSGKKENIEYIYVNSNDETTPTLRLTVIYNKKYPDLVFPNLSKVDKEKRQSVLTDIPKITFSDTTFDFGDVKKGEVVSHNFTIVNRGNSTLEIKRIRTSCGCTAALLNKTKLEAGESGVIHVEFDSSIENGSVSRIIEVISNDPINEKSILKIHANVKG